MKKCPSSIWCQDSNSQPLEHESPPITTRPGLQSLADGAKTCLWCGRMILYLRAPIKIFCLNKRVFERFYWSSVSVWPDSDAIFGGHICIIWHSWSIEVSIDWFIDCFLCIQSINAFIAQTGNVIGVLSGTYISYIALIASFDNDTWLLVKFKDKVT